MKNLKKYLGIIMMTTIIASSATMASAQRGNRQKCDGIQKECRMNKKMPCNYLNLTDKQQADFTKLKLNKNKQILPLKNNLNVLRAQKHSLMTTERPDIKAIIVLINKMGDIQTQIQIINAKKHLEMRSLLTEVQKMKFDNMMNKKKMGSRMGNRISKNNRMKNCPNIR